MLIVWFLSIKSSPNLLFGVLCLPGDQSHPVCATVNKPSFVLHLLGWFIGSRGFSSLERRPEFWVLQNNLNVHRQIKMMWGVCIATEYYSAIKKNKIMPFTAT